MKPPSIQYETAKLEAQYPIICESKWKALQNVIYEAHARTVKLKVGDPPELWRYAIGHSEPFTDWEPYNQFRANLGEPTLRESVRSLTSRFKDDPLLANHLTTLLKIYKRGPFRKVEYDLNRADGDAVIRFLIQQWIETPLSNNWAYASLCFYSDLAMAKMVYFRANKQTKWLPPELLTKEPERIRKLYSRLGLIPASPRAIKDIDFKAGRIQFIPFQKTTFL
jgi:hypothetical protein